MRAGMGGEDDNGVSGGGDGRCDDPPTWERR